MQDYRSLPAFGDSLEPQRTIETTSSEFLDRDGYCSDDYLRQSSSVGTQINTETHYDSRSSDVEKFGFVERAQEYRLYRRRYVGLVFLTVLNFVTELERSATSPIAETVAHWFGTSLGAVEDINSYTGFAFLVPAPFVIWILNRAGPKWSIVVACAIYILGSWIHFIGASTHSFSTYVAGTLIISVASPFALVAPTRYSRMWFSDRGRTSATGLASLSSAAGSAVGSIIAPQAVKGVTLQTLFLIFSIIATVVGAISLFIPARPPTPPTAVAAGPRVKIWDSIKVLVRTKPFYLQLYSFSIMFGAYQATSSLTLQIIAPYHGTQTESGIANGVLVLCGLVAAFIVSPIIDRTKSHLIVVKIIVPLLAASFTGLAFVPQTRNIGLLYFIFGLIGALSFSVTPCTLEFQVNWTHPASAEVSSTICWTGGFLMSSVIVLAQEALILKKPWNGYPPGSLFPGLILQAILTWTVLPCAMLTGFWIFKRPKASLESGM